MTKQMNHIEARQYLMEEWPFRSIYTANNIQLWSNDKGDIVDKDGEEVVFRLCVSPFTAVEPEKTNRELAEEMYSIWHKNKSHEDIYEFLFNMVDEKIKKAIK